MKRLAIVLLFAACGGKSAGPASPGGASGSASDDDLTIHPQKPGGGAETEFDRRRQAACEQVGAKVAACAVEDTRNDKAHPPTKDELAQLDQTAAIDKREYVKKCVDGPMSSRQVRVMEVCVQQETQCDPFLACLDNMKPPAK